MSTKQLGHGNSLLLMGSPNSGKSLRINALMELAKKSSIPVHIIKAGQTIQLDNLDNLNGRTKAVVIMEVEHLHIHGRHSSAKDLFLFIAPFLEDSFMGNVQLIASTWRHIEEFDDSRDMFNELKFEIVNVPDSGHLYPPTLEETKVEMEKASAWAYEWNLYNNPHSEHKEIRTHLQSGTNLFDFLSPNQPNQLECIIRIALAGIDLSGQNKFHDNNFGSWLQEYVCVVWSFVNCMIPIHNLAQVVIEYL